jgi:hypothetical protein
MNPVHLLICVILFKNWLYFFKPFGLCQRAFFFPKIDLWQNNAIILFHFQTKVHHQYDALKFQGF